MIGKKILCFTKTGIHTGVIVACDPDIGVCIVDSKNPCKLILVCPGASAPGIRDKYPEEFLRIRRLELERIINMLKSGYYSRWEDERNELELWSRVLPDSFTVEWPYGL